MAADQPTEDDLLRLQRLILGGESDSLEVLRERVENPQRRGEDVASVLPTAIRTSHSTGGGLGEALQAPLESGLLRVIRERPERVSEALFPVMGPAIRRAIAEALKGLAQQISQTLDSSLTPRGLRWRFEAKRAGVPLGEYVLRRTLKFRVEQAFLINRDNGLLVSHAHLPDAHGVDEDAVSGMFTAIQDFVHDAFDSQGEEGALQTAELGDVTLWAVRGPFSHLVVVIRGIAPRSVRDDLAVILESVNSQFADGLSNFSGDKLPLNGIDDEVARCLLLQDLSPVDTGSDAKRVPWLWILLAVIGAALLGWFWSNVQLSNELATYRHRLATAPGYAATRLEPDGEALLVQGLRDPLADPLEDVLQAQGWQTRAEFAQYLSLEPELVLRRAHARVVPPDSVTLSLNGSALAVAGIAGREWIAALPALAAAVPGVDRLVLDGLAEAADPALELQRQAESLSGRRFAFAQGTAFAPGVLDQLASFAEAVNALAVQGAAERLRPQLSVIGFADAIGGEGTNMQLKTARAAEASRHLSSSGINPDWITIAVGSSLGQKGVSQPEFRYVEVQVQLIEMPQR